MATEKFRILAVDDDKDILDLIQLALHDEYELLTVQDASTALDLIDVCEPDAVVADIMMPKVTGYTIVEFMKKNSKHEQTVIVFLTAKDNPRDIKYGYKLGANLYLTKPFQPERLVRSLHVLLGGAGLHPRRKTLSMRDVQLRQQLNLGLGSPLGAGKRGETPAPDRSGFGPILPQEEEGEGEDPTNRTTWVG